MNKKDNTNQEVAVDSSQKVSREEGVTPRPELLESLSAMMDNEAEPLEVRRVIKTLGSASPASAELLGSWRRFHAARAVLQEPQLSVSVLANDKFLESVQARLASEAPVTGAWLRRTGPFGRVLRIGGQGLIAATVAAAVLVSYPKLHGTKPQEGQELVAQQSASGSTAMPQFSGDYNAAALTRTVSLDDAARRRLEKAVRNFSGTAAVLNSDSMPMFANQLEPFAPVKNAAERSDPQK